MPAAHAVHGVVVPAELAYFPTAQPGMWVWVQVWACLGLEKHGGRGLSVGGYLRMQSSGAPAPELGKYLPTGQSSQALSASWPQSSPYFP